MVYAPVAAPYFLQHLLHGPFVGDVDAKVDVSFGLAVELLPAATNHMVSAV